MKPAIAGQRTGFIDSALEAAAQHEFRVSLIYCVAPVETIREHFQQRGIQRDDHYDRLLDPNNHETGWLWFLKTFINVPGPIHYEHLQVDTTKPVNENLGIIVAYLNRL